MAMRRMKPDPKKAAEVLAEARRLKDSRGEGYRERALKLFPHVCGRCGRDFAGTDLRELTVHHKDHNHGNNPPDGGNWELLCLYCHDQEHAAHEQRGGASASGPFSSQEPALGHSPFAGLMNLLPGEDKDDAAD